MLENLLLIDPDQEILDTFKRFLERHDYSVATAASGAEATRQLRFNRPDLIVIEPEMSGDWGERVLDQYRHTAADVPVIGLSKHKRSKASFPFSVYHVKPISLMLLLECIRTTLLQPKTRSSLGETVM